MASVVGIDLGNQNTVIAVARNRGVDVITNEVSNRSTPSLVGFGPKSRYLGEAAKTQEISNLKNTVSCLKRLAGRNLSDPDVEIEKEYISSALADVGGQVGAEVNYMGKKEQFTATQLVAMFLTKIKQITENELKPVPVSDVVVSCPAWFTDVQRRSLLDAAEIAGLKMLRLMNDTTAAALGYGITKVDLPAPDEKPRRVAFIDIGHSNYTCSVVEFRKGELNVKATTFDRHFGGRDFDKALLDHLAKEFKGKYKIDIFSHPRAKARVLAAAEKLKKVLSANQQAPLNIESLMNDIDVSAMVSRQEFEAMVEPLLARVHVPLEQALADAGLSPEDVDFVELIGGGTRVPSIKERISAFFNKPLSFTLNQDEAIARGCAFSCAMLSPVFQVRAFTVHDITAYPIEFAWEKAPDIPDEDTSLTVFNKNNIMPSTKILTFYRKQPFDLEARYAKPEGLPGKVAPWIGRFSVKGVHADDKDDFMICKLKARVNIHGVLNVESGYHVEEEEVEEEIKEDGEKKDPDVSASGVGERDANFVSSSPIPMSSRDEDGRPNFKRQRVQNDLDAGPPDSERACISFVHTEDSAVEGTNVMKAMETDSSDKPKKTRKVKKQVRKGDLPIAAGTSSLDANAKNSAMEKEIAMVMEDKLVADTEEKKNELETYIYDMRNKLDDQYAEFASDEEKEVLKAKLMETEDWLYDEGDDSTKAVYVAKMEEIRSMAGPIVQRHFDKLEAEKKAKELEIAAKKAAEEEARKAAEEEARKAAGGGQGEGEKDEEMPDADASKAESDMPTDTAGK